MRWTAKQAKAVCDLLRTMHSESLRESGINTVCKPGCFYCCYELVTGGRPEATMMLYAFNRLPQDTRKRVHKRIAKWLQGYRKLDGKPDPVGYLKAKLLCPFCENGNCLIYGWRPMGCRTYINTVDPMQCHPDRAVYYEYPVVAEITVLSVTVLSDPPFQYTLLELIAHELDIARNVQSRVVLPDLPTIANTFGLTNTMNQILQMVTQLT